jgi:hypothetical protein
MVAAGRQERCIILLRRKCNNNGAAQHAYDFLAANSLHRGWKCGLLLAADAPDASCRSAKSGRNAKEDLRLPGVPLWPLENS